MHFILTVVARGVHEVLLVLIVTVVLAGTVPCRRHLLEGTVLSRARLLIGLHSRHWSDVGAHIHLVYGIVLLSAQDLITALKHGRLIAVW
jgi:hypothetical protein